MKYVEKCQRGTLSFSLQNICIQTYICLNICIYIYIYKYMQMTLSWTSFLYYWRVRLTGNNSSFTIFVIYIHFENEMFTWTQQMHVCFNPMTFFPPPWLWSAIVYQHVLAVSLRGKWRCNIFLDSYRMFALQCRRRINSITSQWLRIQLDCHDVFANERRMSSLTIG